MEKDEEDIGGQDDNGEMAGVVSGSMVKSEKVRFLWPGVLMHGSLNLLTGGKGVGKSSLMAAIAATVCSGKALPETKAKYEKSACLWFGSEEGFSTAIKPRWVANGGNPDYLHTVQPGLVQGVTLPYLPDNEALLLKIVRRLHASMIVLDPYSSLAHPALNLNHEQQCRCYLESLARICSAAGATAMMSQHFRKGTSGGLLERGIGSIAVPNVSRLVLRADRDKDDPDTCWLTTMACNHGKAVGSMPYTLKGTKDHVFIAKFGKRADMTIEEILEGHEEADTRDESKDARRLLERALAGGPVSAKTLIKEARDAGIGERTLRKAKAEMRIDSKRMPGQQGEAAVWKWSIPKPKVDPPKK